MSKVRSTKLWIEDYNAFLTLTKLEYEPALIKEQASQNYYDLQYIIYINQLHSQPEYTSLVQEQQQKDQNNQQHQQLYNKSTLQSITTTAKQQLSKLFQKQNVQATK